MLHAIYNNPPFALRVFKALYRRLNAEKIADSKRNRIIASSCYGGAVNNSYNWYIRNGLNATQDSSYTLLFHSLLTYHIGIKSRWYYLIQRYSTHTRCDYMHSISMYNTVL